MSEERRRQKKNDFEVRWGKKKLLMLVGFEPTPEDWCLKPAP